MASLQFFITVLTLVLGNIRAKDEILSSVTCERHTMEITCTGNIIRIVNASYGRHIRNVICPHGNTIGCHAESSMNIVETYCNGKERCKIPARNSIFGDPCVGVHKYLSVNYTCQACNTVEPVTRTDCGYSGISGEECLSKGCCFDNSIPNVTECFFQAKPQATGTFITTIIPTDTDTYDPTNWGNVTDENNIHGTTYTFYDTSSAETNTEAVVGGVVGAVGVAAIILAVVGVFVYRRRYKTAELNLANSTKPEAPEYYNVPFHSNIRTTTSTIQNHDQALPNGTQQDTSLNENEGIYEPVYSNLENKDVYTHLQNTTGSEVEPKNIDSSCGYTSLNLPNVSDRQKRQEIVNSYLEVESTNHDTDDYAYAYGQFDKNIKTKNQ